MRDLLAVNAEYKRQAVQYAYEADQLHHLIVQVFAAWRETLYHVDNLERKVRIMQEMQGKYEEMCDAPVGRDR